jgi:leucyl-tRNA synthetase
VNDQSKLRTGPRNSYYDKVFEEEIKELTNIAKESYQASVPLPPLKFA